MGAVPTAASATNAGPAPRDNPTTGKNLFAGCLLALDARTPLRHTFDTKVTESDMVNTYLPAFRAARIPANSPESRREPRGEVRGSG